MARLLLLNGAPCSGKSTLARRCAADHPLALALDVDVVRSLLGGWVDDPQASGAAARALALAMARTHLMAGHDVVVPQLLARLAFIHQLEALAGEVGVPFDEVVAQAGLPEVLARFCERSALASRQEHRDAVAGPPHRRWRRDGRGHLRPAARRPPTARGGLTRAARSGGVRPRLSVRSCRASPAWRV